MATLFDGTGYDNEEYGGDEDKGKLQGVEKEKVVEKEEERRSSKEVRSRGKSSRMWAALKNKVEMTRISIEEQQKNIKAAQDELRKGKQENKNWERRVGLYHGEWRKVGGTILVWLRSILRSLEEDES